MCVLNVIWPQHFDCDSLSQLVSFPIRRDYGKCVLSASISNRGDWIKLSTFLSRPILFATISLAW